MNRCMVASTVVTRAPPALTESATTRAAGPPMPRVCARPGEAGADALPRGAARLRPAQKIAAPDDPGRQHGRMQLRAATPEDADAIAALHADSWRRNYRGAF